MNEDIVNIESLDKFFGKQAVLKDINANVGRGDVIALLGENGAGKTTLLETLLGFSLPTAGTVRLFDNTMATRLGDKEKLRIGYVPQVEELIHGMTSENYLQSISHFYPNWNTKLQQTLLTDWKIPKNKRIANLSLGQKQMVSIIAAMAHEPDLLVLDEPVSSLDPNSRRRFLELLVESHISNNTTVIFSTHIVSDVERVANRIWLMKEGELVIDDDLDTIKEKYGRSLENLFVEVHQA